MSKFDCRSILLSQYLHMINYYMKVQAAYISSINPRGNHPSALSDTPTFVCNHLATSVFNYWLRDKCR